MMQKHIQLGQVKEKKVAVALLQVFKRLAEDLFICVVVIGIDVIRNALLFQFIEDG